VSSLPLYVLSLWACSALEQLFVLILLFLKGNSRKLPRFTAYVAINLCQVVFLVVVYSIWGINSPTSYSLAWYSECVALLAGALATTEILKITLKPYQGIWGLAWRALTVASVLVVALVAMAARGHWAYAKWFELDRGYHITYAAAVIACLLLVRYYSIQVPSAYKLILGGFCFYSCTEILINTVVQAFFKNAFSTYQNIWQCTTLLSFVVVQMGWMAALWKPLPVEDRQAAPPSDSDYLLLSPQINEHLRLINEKLLRLWKLEAHPN
jgi:hypothetical protein